MAANNTIGQDAPKAVFYNDPKIRALFSQIVVLGLVLALGTYLIHNMLVNREKLGVASGFGFLSTNAGFDISQTLINFSSSDGNYLKAFIVGLLNTFYVAICGIVLATIIGFTMGVARLSNNWIVNKVATVYVEIIRNTPLLLQLIFWYTVVLGALPGARDSWSMLGGEVLLNVRGLFLPKMAFSGTPWPEILAIGAAILGWIGLGRWAKARREATGQPFPTFWAGLALLILLPLLVHLVAGTEFRIDRPQQTRFRLEGGFVVLPEFLALLLGLSIYTGAFLAEIVRSGILSVSKGQTEAAGALGLRPTQALRLVIIPQAMRVIIPPQTSQYLNLTKNSSLGVAIAYPDFFSIAGTINNQTGQAVEVVAIIMAVYLTLSLAISGFMNWYNARIALVER